MFQSSGVFQCSLTGLVFHVNHEGEVTYKTLIWDETLLQTASKVPGGPLFSITCSQASIFRLCLPHCEPEPSKNITVLHIHTPIQGFLFPFLHLCVEKEMIKVKPHLNLCLYSALVAETLSVVHITEDGMSMIKPREITKTHVVVDTPHLSAFGIVWDVLGRFMDFMSKPVSGQVLLFLRPAYRGRNLILSVLLLPSNVPVQEVNPFLPPLPSGQIFLL